MPVHMPAFSRSEQFIVQFVRMKDVLHRFRGNGHVPQERVAEGGRQLVQFRCVFLAEQKRISLKARNANAIASVPELQPTT